MIEDDPDKQWMMVKFTLGKYKGRTLGDIRLSDHQYFLWAIQNMSAEKPHVLKAMEEADEYINKTDPWAR